MKLCPHRDLSVDTSLSPAQFQVRPIPQHYQHYLATPRMHHFPRNSSSTQMVSDSPEGTGTSCLLHASGEPRPCFSQCPEPSESWILGPQELLPTLSPSPRGVKRSECLAQKLSLLKEVRKKRQHSRLQSSRKCSVPKASVLGPGRRLS